MFAAPCQGYLRDPWRAAAGRSAAECPGFPNRLTTSKQASQKLTLVGQRAGAVSHSPRTFAPPVRRARQGTADRTNVNLVRREGIVPVPESESVVWVTRTKAVVFKGGRRLRKCAM